MIRQNALLYYIQWLQDRSLARLITIIESTLYWHKLGFMAPCILLHESWSPSYAV